MGEKFGEDNELSRRGVLKTTLVSSMIAGLPITGKTARAAPATVGRDAISGEPSYRVGKDIGFYLWRTEDTFHLQWTGDTDVTGDINVVEFEVTTDGSVSVTDRESWNDTDFILTEDTSRVHGKAAVGPGFDGVDLSISDATAVTFDLRFSEDLSQSTWRSMSGGEKEQYVKDVATAQHPELVFLGEDRSNPEGLPLTVTLADRTPGFTGTYYNLPESHPDMQADETSRDLGLVQPTLPLRLTAAGEREYEQFDWFDDRYRSFSRDDETLDWPSDFFPVDEGKPGDPFHFAVHWTATMDVPEGGTYSFGTASDDESWVFVDGELVVDNGGSHSRTRREGAVDLAAGAHDVDIFFAERHTGGSNFTFDAPDGVTFSTRTPTRLPQVEKQELIETIRSEASELMLDFRAENLDERAEELLVEIDQALSNEEETFQFEEALQRMLTAESVTESATRIGKDPARETAAKLTELLIMLAFVAIAKAAVRGAGRLGTVVAAKLDDAAAKARRGVKELAGRPVLPAGAKRELDDIIDGVNSRVDDWLGNNADDIESAGESIVKGPRSINDVFGLLTGAVIEGLAAIKEFAIDALSVLFYDLYMTDNEEFNDDGERIEPPGIGRSINNRMDELDEAIDDEALEATGADERDKARADRISDFREKQEEFLAAMEAFDDITAGASLAVLVLAGIAVALYAISLVLSASGIGLTVAAALSSAASTLTTIAGGIGTGIILLTGFSVLLGFGFLRNRRREHDGTVDFVVNYETSGGGA